MIFNEVMSKYGHDNIKYYSNVDFPKESFTIAGISYFQQSASKIMYKDVLTMKCEPENKYPPPQLHRNALSFRA